MHFDFFEVHGIGSAGCRVLTWNSTLVLQKLFHALKWHMLIPDVRNNQSNMMAKKLSIKSVGLICMLSTFLKLRIQTKFRKKD